MKLWMTTKNWAEVLEAWKKNRSVLSLEAWKKWSALKPGKNLEVVNLDYEVNLNLKLEKTANLEPTWKVDDEVL